MCFRGGITRDSPVAATPCMVAVAAVPSVEEMHQRAQSEQDEGQCPHEVGAVLGEEEEPGHCEEAKKDPRHRYPTVWLRVAYRVGQRRNLVHDLPLILSWERPRNGMRP
jgi:hypothetical protein